VVAATGGYKIGLSLSYLAARRALDLLR